MDFINGYFYIGNDDEQIARSTNLISWTIVDDQDASNFDYWNDIAGFVGTDLSNTLVNGDQEFTLNADGSVTFPDGSIQTTAYTGVAVYAPLPSWITVVSGTEHLPTLNTDYGWDNQGAWTLNSTILGNEPEGTSYPFRTTFSIPNDTKSITTVDFFVGNMGADFGIGVFAAGTDPVWAWDYTSGNNEANRIGAQYNGPVPELHGKSGGYESGYSLPGDGTYRARLTVEPTGPGIANITLETLDTNNTVLDTITYEETSFFGTDYKIGFASDQDDGDPAVYFNNLTIDIDNGATIYTDTLMDGSSAGSTSDKLVNGSQEFTLNSDGSITFPDGSIQTTAYTGSVGELYIMANVDGDIVTSTNGIDWTAPQASGMPGIQRVEIHNGVIVYIPSGEMEGAVRGLYYSTELGTVTLCAGTDISTETDNDLFWQQVHYFAGSDKWVAVGYNDGDTNKFPVLAHSDNGITWTVVFVDNTFVTGFNTDEYDWRLTDVAWLDETNQYVITSFLDGPGATGGIFITEDITVALDGTTHVAIDFNARSVVPWSVVGFGGPPGYVILIPFLGGEGGGDILSGWGTDPEDYSSAFGLWEQYFIDELGYAPTLTEVAYKNGDFIGVTNDGQVATIDFVGEPSLIISIPLPYTNTVFSISNANPAVITWGMGNSNEANNEKIVVTLAGEYNGTYYVNSSTDVLYTDLAMTTALDASGFAAFTSGTVTFSHGQYFDAAGASNSYYYIGNDDEQVFRSSNGITWTQQADFTGEYFNDFAYGSFGTTSSNTLVNGDQTLTLNSDGSITFPDDTVQTTAYTGVVSSLTDDKEIRLTVGNTEYFAIVNRANNHNDGVESSAVEYDSLGNLITLHISEIYNNDADTYTDKLIISKFTSTGTLLWQKQIVEDADNSQGHDIVIDSDDNIIVIFNQDNAIDYQDSLVVIKFDSIGTEQWKKLYHPTETVTVYRNFDVNASGVTVGTFEGTTVDVVTITYDYAYLSENTGWSLQESGDDGTTWTTIAAVLGVGAYNSGTDTTPLYIAENSPVEIILGSPFQYRVTRQGVDSFVEAAGSATDDTHTYIAARYTAGGTNDYDNTWLMKIVNSTGALVWAEKIQFVDEEGDEAYGMDIDSLGNIVVVGVAYTGGPTYSYVAKFNGTTGAEIWTKVLAGYNINNCTSGDVTIDSQNNIFVSFNSNEEIVNESFNNFNVTIAHVVKINSAGVIQWTRRIGPGPCMSVGTGIDCDAAGNVYLSALTEAQDNPTRDESNDDNNTNVLVVAKYSTTGIVLWQRYIQPEGYEFYQSKYNGSGSGFEYNANSGRNLSVSADGKLAVQVSVRQKVVDGVYDTVYWESITFQIDQDGREMTVGSGNEKFTVKASRIPGKLTTLIDIVELGLGGPYSGPTITDLTSDVDVTDASITYEAPLLAQQTATSAPYEYVFGNDGTLTIPNDGDIKLVQTQIGWFSIFGPTANDISDITPRANCVDPETGDVYMVGRSDDSSEGFVARYNSQGEILWCIRLGEDSDGFSSRCNAVKINPVTGNLMVLTEMYGPQDNTALIEIDPDTARVVRQSGIRDNNNNNGCLGYDLDFLSDGKVIIVGRKYDEYRPMSVTAATGSGTGVLIFLRANIIASTSQSPDNYWYVNGTGITGRVAVDSVNRYSGLTTTVNQGSGQGCILTLVPYDNGTVDFVFAIDAAGTDYGIGDVLTVAGTQFPGGTSPANDITMTVVDASGGGVGGVATIGSVTGTATTTHWRIQTTAQTPDYSTGTFNILQPLNGEAFVLAGTTDLVTGEFTIDWSKTVSGGEEDVTDRYLSVAVSGTDIYAVGEMIKYNDTFAGADFDNVWCAVVSKFNSAGVHQWTKVLNDTTHNCYARSVSVYGASLVVTHQNTNNSQTVITKLTSTTGTILWQRKTYSWDDSSVAIDTNGDIYAVIESNFENQFNDIIKVIKFNANGEIVWRNFFGTLIRNGDGTSEAFKNGRNLTLDADHLYVSGYTSAFNNWAKSGFLVKLPKTGDCDGAYSAWVVESEQYNVDKIWDTSATSATPLVGTGEFETVDMYFYSNWWDPSDSDYYQTLNSILDRDGGAIEFADGTRQTTSAQMIPQVPLTYGADHRLNIDDMGKHIYVKSNESTIIIPYNEEVALPIGFVVTVINNSGSDVSIDGAGNSLTIIGPNQIESGYWDLAHQGMATLIKVENSVWFITGNVSDDS
jgi:hypothetical protein